MCTGKNVRCHEILKLVSYLGFGIFGLTGGAFYADYMAHKDHDCSDPDTDATMTPDCYSQHFFGAGWLIMAACVPFFGIFGECKPKITIIGTCIAFIAASFGLYYVIMVLVDDQPYNIFNAQQPRYDLGHGFIVMAEGLRNGFELLAVFAMRNEKKQHHRPQIKSTKKLSTKVQAVPLDSPVSSANTTTFRK